MPVFSNVTKEDAARLLKKGFEMMTPKSEHEALRMKKGSVSLTLYKSGKLVVQGKDSDAVVEMLERMHTGTKEKKETFRKEKGWIIGSDETLKGDTFGGLVVAAVKADDTIRQRLLDLGVADSKKLSDTQILPLAREIRKIAECEIKSLTPEEYNRKFKTSVTVLLDNLHHECGQYLKPGKHIVDKYPGCTAGDLAVTKAESKYIEVAAASILARAAGIEQLRALSKIVGFTVPKGSTHVKEALEALKEQNVAFEKFVKMHFRNVTKFLENFGTS